MTIRATILAGLLAFAAPAAAAPVYVDQGAAWTAATRADFYTRDQGSRIMPLAWMKALALPGGQPFLGDGLARYGYLANPGSPQGLPVGFVATAEAGVTSIGMTCSACHTREISAGGKSYRIDGGPGIVDFQAFLTDLDAAVGRVLATDAAFTPFATKSLGHAPSAAERTQLKADVTAWYVRFHTLMTKALPAGGWGLGRLDAFGMIFNRLTGLDLGPPPSRIIAGNIHTADAPVRYPFIWNAPTQDRTQWPGIADNGIPMLGAARNMGEVFGVFANFAPRRNALRFNGIDWWTGNSANWSGLWQLERLVKTIGAPKWPFPIDQALAARGKPLFMANCDSCHGQRPGIVRPIGVATWATPVVDVGTDSRQYQVMSWTVDTGVLNDHGIVCGFGACVIAKLKPQDSAINTLKVAVVGSILQKIIPFAADATTSAAGLSPEQKALTGAYRQTEENCAPGKFCFEARVLYGAWAAAPYLHNGSVASLAELLKPDSQRLASFAVGAAYDPATVGLATVQAAGAPVRQTSGCDDRNSGNSRCGHNYGTTLGEADRAALLEYLKTL